VPIRVHAGVELAREDVMLRGPDREPEPRLALGAARGLGELERGLFTPPRRGCRLCTREVQVVPAGLDRDPVRVGRGDVAQPLRGVRSG
jgi:hypothetical protein